MARKSNIGMSNPLPLKLTKRGCFCKYVRNASMISRSLLPASKQPKRSIIPFGCAISAAIVITLWKQWGKNSLPLCSFACANACSHTLKKSP